MLRRHAEQVWVIIYIIHSYIHTFILLASAAIRPPSVNRQSPTAIQQPSSRNPMPPSPQSPAPSTSRAAPPGPQPRGLARREDPFRDRRDVGHDQPATASIIHGTHRSRFRAHWDRMNEQECKEGLKIYHKYLMLLFGSVKKLKDLNINPGRVNNGATRGIYVSHTRHTYIQLYIHTYILFKFQEKLKSIGGIMVKATETEFARNNNNPTLTYTSCTPKICLLHGTYQNHGINLTNNHRFSGQFGIDHAVVEGLFWNHK